jgi:hypothetical protein
MLCNQYSIEIPAGHFVPLCKITQKLSIKTIHNNPAASQNFQAVLVKIGQNPIITGARLRTFSATTLLFGRYSKRMQSCTAARSFAKPRETHPIYFFNDSLI